MSAKSFVNSAMAIAKAKDEWQCEKEAPRVVLILIFLLFVSSIFVFASSLFSEGQKRNENETEIERIASSFRSQHTFLIHS